MEMRIHERKDTFFIRFLAIFLITNSHLDSLYPIPYLGTGGALGNSLFFMLSGYGLALSGQVNDRPFLQWYWRRILRIYPSLIVVVAIIDLWLGKGWQTWTLGDYFAGFIWPTPAWFVSALMIFYVVFFLIMKIGRPVAYVMVILALFIPYFYFYFNYMDLTQYTIEGPSYFKWIFYLQIMLFGGYLACRKGTITGITVMHLLLLFAGLALYYGILIMIKFGYGGRFQALIHVITFSVVYLILILSRSRFVIEKIMSQKALNFVITLIGGLTLEIYLLQYTVYSNSYIQSLAFPLNIALFWIAVIILSKILHMTSGFIRDIIGSRA
jgi:peptidoglycan/LPS O-acetylase OafA/YrhL